MKNKTRAWITVFSSMLLLASVYGYIVNSFTLYVVPLSVERGVGRENVSLCLTLVFLFYMVSSFTAGKVLERVGIKRSMTACVILIPLLTYLRGIDLPFLYMYLSSALLGFLLPFISFTALGIVIKSWFDENQGLAVGLAFTGSGIGGMAWSLVIGSVMEKYGTAFSFRFAAIVMIVTALPLVIFGIKERKTEKMVAENEKKTTLKSALETKGLWRVLILSFLMGLTPLFVSQAMVPMALDKGLGTSLSSMLNASFMLGLCLMKIVMGYSYDKFGIKSTMAVIQVCTFVSAYLLLNIERSLMLVPFIVVLSISGTVQSMSPTILSSSISSDENFPTVSGIAVAVNYLGCALSPLLLNYVYSKTGSYSSVVASDFILLPLALLLIVFWKRSVRVVTDRK
ncbi:MAG: MFS transporter [Candidatus Ornithospirochaeta sp.]